MNIKIKVLQYMCCCGALKFFKIKSVGKQGEWFISSKYDFKNDWELKFYGYCKFKANCRENRHKIKFRNALFYKNRVNYKYNGKFKLLKYRNLCQLIFLAIKIKLYFLMHHNENIYAK